MHRTKVTAVEDALDANIQANSGGAMSHSTSSPTPRASSCQESPAVRSALKAAVAATLAAEASAPGRLARAPLEHLAGPGRLHATQRA
jgi:hypothetical protein